jgi:hypothetical protein
VQTLLDVQERNARARGRADAGSSGTMPPTSRAGFGHVVPILNMMGPAHRWHSE